MNLLVAVCWVAVAAFAAYVLIGCRPLNPGRWQERWYVYLQAGILVLTAANLHPGVAEFPAMHTWVDLGHSIRASSFLEPCRFLLYAGVSVALLQWGKRWDRRARATAAVGPAADARADLSEWHRKAKAEEQSLLSPDDCVNPPTQLAARPALVPFWRAVLRNITMYCLVLLVDCSLTSALDCGGLGLSGVPLAAQVTWEIDSHHRRFPVAVRERLRF